MIRIVSTVAILVGAATLAIAQGDPIAERQQIMKSYGQATGAGAKMAKGETPFELAKAKEFMQTYATGATKAQALFPQGSNTGRENAASPKIWESKADFDKRWTDFGADAQKASAGITDLESFRTNFGAVTRGCGGCHESYRLKKS